MTKDAEHFFHMLHRHLYFVLGELSVHSIGSFIDRVFFGIYVFKSLLYVPDINNLSDT